MLGMKGELMDNFILIKSKDIEEVLQLVSRQYLAGNLERPQKLKYLHDEHLEIGITDYNKYTIEPVHFHTEAIEYQYMLSGWTKYMDVEHDKEYEFKKGDFYCIEKNTTYAQKSKKGTRILFIKVPSINDKNVVETSEAIKEWYAAGLKTVRKDYAHEEVMPEANSIRPAAAVAIVNNEKILMLKRMDNEMWTLPGGTMELHESLIDCAVREVLEETGLDVQINDVIGTYTDPDVRIEYSDGEVRREFTIVYYGKASNCNEVVLDEESSTYAWIPLSDVESYPMAKSQRKRVLDAITYYKIGQKRMG